MLRDSFCYAFMDMAGIKVHESNENEMVLEPAVRWAGNPSITLVLKILSFRITLQVRHGNMRQLNFLLIRIDRAA